MTPGGDLQDLMRLRRQYEGLPFDVTDLAPTWHEQFDRWLSDAIDSGMYEPNAMQLATADASGVPSARTVLLRGIDDRGFAFYTNLESRKGREARANPRASLVFAWVPLHRQVVASGRVEDVATQDADAYWAARPLASRISAAASPQSQVVASRESLEAARARIEEHGEDIPRPPFWGGLRVVPETVEFWQGRPDRFHDRLRYRRENGDWVVERLGP